MLTLLEVTLRNPVLFLQAQPYQLAPRPRFSLVLFGHVQMRMICGMVRSYSSYLKAGPCATRTFLGAANLRRKNNFSTFRFPEVSEQLPRAQDAWHHAQDMPEAATGGWCKMPGCDWFRGMK